MTPHLDEKDPPPSMGAGGWVLVGTGPLVEATTRRYIDVSDIAAYEGPTRQAPPPPPPCEKSVKALVRRPLRPLGGLTP